MALFEKRVLIDATGASIGGGYTYLVNVIPRLCALAPGAKFRLLLRNQRLVEVLTPHAERESNLEITSLPSVGIGARLLHVFFVMPSLAKDWGADVYFRSARSLPRTCHVPRSPVFATPMSSLAKRLHPVCAIGFASMRSGASRDSRPGAATASCS